jgi:hypothetical protein
MQTAVENGHKEYAWAYMKLHFKKHNSVIEHTTITLVFRFCRIWLQNTPSPEKMELRIETESTGTCFSHIN